MRYIALLLLALASTTAARAQSDDWVLAQAEKDAIGIVEVRIGAKDLPLDANAIVETGTGAIVSSSGYVLTAGHILSADNYAICAGAPNADPAKACKIYFLSRGDTQARYELRAAGPPAPDRDFLLLRLPSAADAGRTSWPRLTLAQRSVDSEAIYATGYRGADRPLTGGANSIDTFRGSLRGDQAASCENSYGTARNATVMSVPGTSGGPTFNRLHKVVGIVLGPACSGATGTLNDDNAPRSRILLIEDMAGLCATTGLDCYFGFDGDTDRLAAGLPAAWNKRLVGGEAVADRILYGLRLREVSRLINYGPLCAQFANDAQLAQSLKNDAAQGGELATVYAALWAGCRPGATPADAGAARQDVARLADLGYEPAQFLMAEFLLNDVRPQLGLRRYPSDPLLLGPNDRESLDRAEQYLRTAASHDWPAAAEELFSYCSMRVFRCQADEASRYLDQAVGAGQRDALRLEAIASLVGDSPQDASRFGFSRPQNDQRALALLQQAAAPLAGTSVNANLTLYDVPAAAYLSYFYGGGTYRGRRIVNASPALALQYNMLCVNGSGGLNAVFEYCGMINAVGQFNNAVDVNSRSSNWTFIQQFIPWAVTAGPLAKNLATWSSDGGRDIDRIECPLNDTLQFAAPAAPSSFEPGVAYCYFAKPS